MTWKTSTLKSKQPSCRTTKESATSCTSLTSSSLIGSSKGRRLFQSMNSKKTRWIQRLRTETSNYPTKLLNLRINSSRQLYQGLFLPWKQFRKAILHKWRLLLIMKLPMENQSSRTRVWSPAASTITTRRQVQSSLQPLRAIWMNLMNTRLRSTNRYKRCYKESSRSRHRSDRSPIHSLECSFCTS